MNTPSSQTTETPPPAAPKRGLKRVLVMIEHHDTEHPEHGAVYDLTALVATLPDPDSKQMHLYSLDMSLNVYAAKHGIPMELHWRSYKGDGSGFSQSSTRLSDALRWGAAESDRVKWLKAEAEKLKIEANRLLRDAERQHGEDVAAMPAIQPICRVVGALLPATPASGESGVQS